MFGTKCWLWIDQLPLVCFSTTLLWHRKFDVGQCLLDLGYAGNICVVVRTGMYLRKEGEIPVLNEALAIWTRNGLKNLLVSSSWKDMDWAGLKKYALLCKEKLLTEVIRTLHIPAKWLKWFSFNWEMHFWIAMVKPLGRSRLTCF